MLSQTMVATKKEVTTEHKPQYATATKWGTFQLTYVLQYSNILST